jgi:hypothetical protein
MNPVPPFFIIGCGRSGTTLLRLILNNHSEVAIPTESLFILDYLKAAPRFTMNDLTRLLVHEPEIIEWGIEPRLVDLSACITVSEAIDKLHKIYADQNRKKHWGQKTPRFVRSLELLKDRFPGARFIHIVRDPRAVANSLIRSDVHRSNAYYAARRWVRDVGAGLAFERQCPGIVMRVSYEELVGSLEATVEKLCRFIGVGFEVKMLNSEREDISNEYSRFYSKVHANLGRSTTDEFTAKWKSQLSRPDIKLVESICSILMEDLGYERLYQDSPGTTVFLAAQAGRIPSIFMQLYQYLRYRPRYLFYLLWRKWRLGLLGSFLGDINQ